MRPFAPLLVLAACSSVPATAPNEPTSPVEPEDAGVEEPEAAPDPNHLLLTFEHVTLWQV